MKKLIKVLGGLVLGLFFIGFVLSRGESGRKTMADQANADAYNAKHAPPPKKVDPNDPVLKALDSVADNLDPNSKLNQFRGKLIAACMSEAKKQRIRASVRSTWVDDCVQDTMERLAEGARK